MKTRLRIAGLCAALAVALSGCSLFYNDNAPHSLDTNTITGGTGTLLPAGNAYLLTLRKQPDGNQPILCAAPDPDWATATNLTYDPKVSGSLPSGPTASLELSASSTEAITALAGRTAGVVALRDGLYSACQAYANGIIGRDAYALILSQYGDVLDNIVNGTAGSSGAAAGSGAGTSGTINTTPTAVALNLSTGQASSTSTTGKGADQQPSTSTTASAANGQVGALQEEAVQAMVVACITDNDPIVHPTDDLSQRQGTFSAPETNDNALLSADGVCKKVLQNVSDSIPQLLKPVVTASAGSNQNGQNAGASGQQAIKTLQQALKKDGDLTGTVDGLWGSQTQAALAKYVAKNGKLPAG